MSLFRIILYMVVAIFLISIVRGVIGVVMKGFADLVAPPRQRQTTAGGPKPDSIPLSGELKKDPVCGTYTSAATALKQTFGKDTLYFCSPECRDKYAAEAHRS
jgi:YHS domain-containing protein